jgi:hypothetical protein
MAPCAAGVRSEPEPCVIRRPSARLPIARTDVVRIIFRKSPETVRNAFWLIYRRFQTTRNSWKLKDCLHTAGATGSIPVPPTILHQAARGASVNPIVSRLPTALAAFWTVSSRT